MQTPPRLTSDAALFLDFDGTLVALAETPEAIEVPPALVALLTDLHALLGGALAIVSGRQIDSIDRFLAPLRLPAAGEHGVERRDATGAMHEHHTPDLHAVLAAVNELAGRHTGLLVERKHAAIALHYRLAPDLEAVCQEAMSRIVAGKPHFELLHGKFVFEIKPSGINKGTAIDAFMQEAPFAGRTPVFAGDDTTDETGFAVVQPRGGVAIKVGTGPTQAAHRLESPLAVYEWLLAARDLLQMPAGGGAGMSRLVVVSNRVADPRKPAAGGLAVALGESLQQTGGLWFGWSGTIVEGGPTGEGEMHRQQAGKVTLATIDLSREDHDSYYAGYSNDVLWPVFHNRLDLANFEAGFIGGYRRVNQLFARKLMPLLKDDDVIWVHDYHLIPLAAELRAMGCRQRIGFFLHIPLPPQIIMAAIPQHEWLARSLFSYDLIGFQAQQDVQHFEHYVVKEAHGEPLGDDMYRAYGKTVRCSAFPIGIDVDEFVALTHAKEARDMYETMKREYSTRRLLLGIDRLDYSKGIPDRVRAFRDLLANYPENRRSATLIQIASPTRESVDAYADIRRELESLCGAINGDYGELDWMPVRYIHRMVARKRVPGLCRAAAVGLVTPLRDGMNLVAKEYIAAQDPQDPGVLVLSRFAGAAEQLKEALLVNPYDTHGTAETIQQALQMPLEERRARHAKLLGRIRDNDIHWWRRTFLEALRTMPQAD